MGTKKTPIELAASTEYGRTNSPAASTFAPAAYVRGDDAKRLIAEVALTRGGKYRPRARPALITKSCSKTTYLTTRPIVQLRTAMTEPRERAETASIGFVRRAKPTNVNIATGNPNVRAIVVVFKA
jgi:hypothetical protein